MANPRTLARLAARIQERAAHCLEFEIKDPRSSFVTITEVEVSRDLSQAKIHYSVLGSLADRNRTARMLESASGFIQSKVARVLKVRRVPRLVWVYDGSAEYAANMDLLIREALKKDREIGGRAPSDEAQEKPGEDWESEYEGFVDEEEDGEA